MRLEGERRTFLKKGCSLLKPHPSLSQDFRNGDGDYLKNTERVEDLVLGYQLNIKNKYVEPIPYINIMMPFLFMKEMINSHSRVFMIGLRLYWEGKYIEPGKGQSIIPAVKEFIECMMWLLCCPIMWTAFIMCAVRGYINVGLIFAGFE